MEPYPTTTQVAALLNLTRPTVARYVREGVLRGCRIGRVWRIDPGSIKRLLELGTAVPAEGAIGSIDEDVVLAAASG